MTMTMPSTEQDWRRLAAELRSALPREYEAVTGSVPWRPRSDEAYRTHEAAWLHHVMEVM